MCSGGKDAIVHVQPDDKRLIPTIMQISTRGFSSRLAINFLFVLAGVCSAASQQVSMALLEPQPFHPAAAPMVKNLPAHPTQFAVEQHKFWDGRNKALFATVAAFSAADFVVTRNNLNSGGRELNPLTQPFAGSTAGLAVNFAGETAGVIGVSYLFHKTGHHKLERLAPLVNIGMSAFAVSYGLAHR